MRFLVDECTGPRVARWLREQQHDVRSIYDEARGLDDGSVLEMAVREDRILITNDTDFGERVFRSRQPHRGIVLLRLMDERPVNKIAVLKHLLDHHAADLEGAFVVAGDASIRFVRS